MKILHVVLTLKYGGLEQMVARLAKALNRSGIINEVVCLEEKGDLASDLEKNGIPVFSMDKKPGRDFGLIFKLAKLAKERKADIIHTHNMGALVYGSLAGIVSRIPTINTRHGRTGERTSRFIWNANRFVVPVSVDTKNFLLKNNRIDATKLKVVYNGVDVKQFDNHLPEEKRSEFKKKLGIAANSFVLMTVGRLSKEKDQETLLKAFRKLIKKNFNGDLILVGDGPLRQKLEEKAKELEVSQRVKFLGFRDDVHDILKIADVFVLPSFREGLSLAILEAMACGKPVVATKVGGTPEVVVEGETGYLVPCGYPERIEVAVMKLYINRKLAAEVGAKGRKRAEDVFGLDKMVAAYVELYRQAAKK